MAIPRFEFRANVLVVLSVPPLKTILPAVALAGAAPKPESAEIDRTPALIMVGLA